MKNEAQRLADQLNTCEASGLWYRSSEAASELRRLDAVNAQMLEFAEWVLSLKTGGMIEGRARAAIAATGETK